MSLVIVIDTGNDAFVDAYKLDGGSLDYMELVRVLGKISDSIREGDSEGVVQDANGNTVGYFNVGSANPVQLIMLTCQQLDQLAHYYHAGLEQAGVTGVKLLPDVLKAVPVGYLDEIQGKVQRVT